MIPALTLLAALPVQSYALDKTPGKAPSTPLANYRVAFRMKLAELERSGNFTVQDGAQANYVLGGDTPTEAQNSRGEKGIEFKKHGTIVNCIVTGGGRLNAQCQFEISGPLPPQTSLKVNPIATLQLQTTFTAEKGKPLLLVDEPDRRIEITITETAP